MNFIGISIKIKIYDLGTGRKRDFKAEEELTEAERLRKEEEVKNYKVWSKGKKQLEKREENVRLFLFLINFRTL